MNERDKIAWLYRRVGFGLRPGELDELEELGSDLVLDRLLDGDAHGIDPNPDPWRNYEFHLYAEQEFRGQDRQAAIRELIFQMRDTPRPFEEWMRWFWHGHLVTSLTDVQDPRLMVKTLQLYGDLGLGDLRTLLRETTIDPGMLIYLDGGGSVKEAPNENYARELFELFALGIGNYTETDIQQAAAVLTGWKVVRYNTSSFLNPNHKDDTKRTVLGVTGVHDVDTLMDAVVAQEACPAFVTRSLASAILGSPLDDVLMEELATEFRDSGLEIRPLVRRILEAGLDGKGGSKIMPPLPWAIQAFRATGAEVEGAAQQVGKSLGGMGQLPMYPPNVSGWPGDAAWLSSSSTVGRLNSASLIASVTPDTSIARQLAVNGEYDALADALGHPEGFGDPTLAALDQVSTAGGPPGVAVLALALASPELAQA